MSNIDILTWNKTKEELCLTDKELREAVRSGGLKKTTVKNYGKAVRGGINHRDKYSKQQLGFEREEVERYKRKRE
ncbi:MAG: hypothetical protein HQ575_03835 [Candidatus Omnitrophica bacterium]|nr:hypothetical protein [Candidatus Omnitrophota bacterium]